MPSNATEMQQELQRLRLRVAEQTAEITRLRELAETDPLTGIANRRGFEKEMRRRYAETRRHDRPFTLMSIDMDDLKSVNDESGHSTGDELLQEIARLLHENVRASDVVARVGGDEFAVILPGADIESARYVAKRIYEVAVPLVQSRFGDENGRLSIGIVQAHPGLTIEQVLETADQRMYRAKEQGGNCFVADEPE
ncbi:MAG: GGDEF domain-containing protein [Pirellulaceae bacterium]